MSKSRRDYNKYWHTPVSKQYKEARRENNRPTLLSYSTKRRTLAYYKSYREETRINIERMLINGYSFKEVMYGLRSKKHE